MAIKYVGSRRSVMKLLQEVETNSSSMTVVDLFSMNWEDLNVEASRLEIDEGTELVILRPYISESQVGGEFGAWVTKTEESLPGTHRVVETGLMPEDWDPFIQNAKTFGYFLVVEPLEFFRGTLSDQLRSAILGLNGLNVPLVNLNIPIPLEDFRRAVSRNFEYTELSAGEYISVLAQFAAEDSVRRLTAYQALISGATDHANHPANIQDSIEIWLGEFLERTMENMGDVDAFLP